MAKGYVSKELLGGRCYLHCKTFGHNFHLSGGRLQHHKGNSRDVGGNKVKAQSNVGNNVP